MLSPWKRWCRLCAKEDGDEVDIFVKTEQFLNLQEILQKFFLITVNPCDETPTMICYTCYRFLRSLMNFVEHTAKVEQMFSELMYQKYNMVPIDPDCLRYQYKLNLPDTISESSKSNKSTDTNDLVVEYLPLEEDDVREDRSQLYTVLLNSPKNQTSNRDDEEEEHKLYPKIESTIKTEEDDSINQIEVLVVEEDSLHNDLGNADVDYIEEEYLDIKPEDEVAEHSKLDECKSNTKRVKSRKLRMAQPVKCEACDKEFSRPGNFRQHLKMCPSVTKPALYPCTKCEKRFPSEKRAQQHEATHLPRELKMIYPCRFCHKKFTKAVNVTTHVKAIHIGQKPFICEECGKTFSTKGALKEHKYTHVEETPYQCSKCPKKFKNLPRLKTHEDTHNDTIYVCPHCGLQLNTKRTLQMHMVVHSDQKKYKCSYCGNEYKRSKALKNHLILHTGLRPYTCPFCDKTFANGSNCRSHKKKAHPLELAAMEAAGESQPTTNIPKLEQLKAVAQATQPVPSPDHSIFDHIEVSLNTT